MESGRVPARRRRGFWATCLAQGLFLGGWLAGVACPDMARGQNPFAQNATAADAEDGLSFPTDRASMQRLATARELLKEERYSEAVRFLGSLLEGAEDYFFQPDRTQKSYRSLKDEAQRLIGAMPAAGRDSYEAQFGAEARNLLDAAAKAGDPAGLAEVSRRFFHTKAGYEATELLGTWNLEQGRPLAAALCFKRLQDTPPAARTFEPTLSAKAAVAWLRAGQTAQAAETLSRLRKQSPDAKVVLAGKEHKLFASDSQAVAWLHGLLGPSAAGAVSTAPQWAMYRGGPTRNAVSQGGTPLLNRRWAVPVVNDPNLERLVEQLRQTYADQGLATLPSLHPLAVSDFIFMRSAGGLVAVDFRNGKRIWHGPVEDSVRQLLDPGSADGPGSDSSNLTTWLDQRLWDDAVYGTLSSDGECIFCVEDLGTSIVPEMAQMIFRPNGQLVTRGGSRSYNRLAAYSIATEGKLKWDVGGAALGERSEWAGAFFLGPPLPLAGRLFALAEIKGEIRLLALDARTGKLEWSQQLAMLERTIEDDPLRRMSGLSPSYSDGVLICPTSAGAVVAVDLTTRSLRWGYQYAGTREQTRGNRLMLFQSGAANQGNQNDRWADASATIADGRVLLTPVDSTELHCLNLLDGTVLWKKDRKEKEGLYIGCVMNDIAMIVGRTNVHAYRLADGSSPWKAAAGATDPSQPLPTGSAPSGRGFFNGTHYFLPLSSAEVAAIDVATGKIVGRARSRTGSVPGNLVCYQNAVVSQGVGQLEVFYQLDELRQQVAAAMAKEANDPAALALQGELLLDEGKINEAADRLRKSFAARPNLRTQQLLVESLLEGLRTDFSAHRGDLAEIEKLIEQPAQQLAYLRQLATGLQQAGELVPAFETYLKVMDLAGEDGELERVEPSLYVRRDRWVQARLKGLQQAAQGADLAAIEGALRTRLDRAIAAPETDKLRTFLNYFGGHPLADEALEQLVTNRADEASKLEIEQGLRTLAASSDATRSRAAVARLAMLMRDANRPEDGASWRQQLAGPLADEVCLSGRTGRQIVEDLTPGEGSADKPADPWPQGVVESEPLKINTGTTTRTFAIEQRGFRGPYFSRGTVELEQQSQQQSVVGRDGWGRERFRVPLAERGTINYGYNPSLSHVRMDGHLLLMSVGFQLIAIDTLGTSGRDGARILWRENLTETLPGMSRNQLGIHGRVVNMPWGLPRFTAADAYGRPVGSTGPATRGVICFQRQRELIAVDPLTGKKVWKRTGVTPGSDLFGDDELLFVTPPNSTEGLVLRMSDGQELGRRQTPPLDQRLVILGRKVVIWTNTGGKQVVKLRDVWTETDLWEQKFEAGSKPFPVNDEAVAVMERSGRLSMIALPDGTTEIDARLTPEPSLSEIYVFRTATRDIVITNRPWKNPDGDSVQAVPGGFGNPMVNGFMYGFDRRTGKLVYSTPIENRSLTFHQPADLPVLTFAALVYRQTRVGREATPRASILCVDKRTGRIAYDEQSIGPIQSIELTGDAEKNQVTLRTVRSAVRLTFTDKPLPTAKATPDGTAAGKEPLERRAGRAILRGVERWFDSLSPEPEAMNRFKPGK